MTPADRQDNNDRVHADRPADYRAIDYRAVRRAIPLSRVLELLGEGLTNAGIARRLFVSIETVKTHVHRVLDKLGVSTRAQAALTVAWPLV